MLTVLAAISLNPNLKSFDLRILFTWIFLSTGDVTLSSLPKNLGIYAKELEE